MRSRTIGDRFSATDNGEPAGTRTRDHRIKSAVLYQLSYRLGAKRNLLSG